MTEFTLTDEQRKVARSRAYDALVALPQYNDKYAPWYDAKKVAEAILDEVGPLIAAQALRDAAAMQDEESARIREAYRQHNANRDPNRPPRRPDLNVWSNADEAAAHRLRARADTIEKEAGR